MGLFANGNLTERSKAKKEATDLGTVAASCEQAILPKRIASVLVPRDGRGSAEGGG